MNVKRVAEEVEPARPARFENKIVVTMKLEEAKDLTMMLDLYGTHGSYAAFALYSALKASLNL